MKCIKCGKALKNNSNFCSSCGTNQNEIDKSNNFGLAIVILLGIVIVIGLSFIGYKVFSNNESNDVQENRIFDDSYIPFDIFHIKIPDGFKYFTNDSIRYFKNDYCTIEFVKYPLSVIQINNNKDLFIKTLENNDYKIVEYIDNKEDNLELITIKVTLNEVEYGLSLYTKNDVTVFFKIVSNNLSNFDDNWFNYIKQIINNIV